MEIDLSQVVEPAQAIQQTSRNVLLCVSEDFVERIKKTREILDAQGSRQIPELSKLQQDILMGLR